MNDWLKRGFLLSLTGWLALTSCAPGQATVSSGPGPEEIVGPYVRAVYARDYAAAYEYVSAANQALKTKDQYVAENPAFTGAKLTLSKWLSEQIQIQNPKVKLNGDHASVTVHVILPDGNAAGVADVLQIADAPEADGQELLSELQKLKSDGQLPTLEGDETYNLVRENGAWRMDLDWNSGIVVTFQATVQAGLQWEFEPLQAQMRVKPGETARARYRVKNISDKAITGKAKHRFEPQKYGAYITKIECFCFTEHTLQPGEEQTLTVIYRIEYDIPSEVNALTIAYDFYPIDAFPES